ncbi:MAG: hypothetical protein ACKOWP_00445 [Microbacteriaceae bacterium]
MKYKIGKLIVVSVVTVQLTSCTAANTDGPLQFTSDQSLVCGPLPEFGEAALGVNLPNGLPEGIVIDSISVLNSQGLISQGAYLMPMTDLRLMLDKFPPTEQFPDEWPQATIAEGTMLDVSQPQDIVIHIVSHENGGTLEGVQVDYSVNGIHYSSHIMMGLKLTPDNCG